MPHPSLGHAPPDTTAGLPEAADRLRASKDRLSLLAWKNAVRLQPTLTDSYDETTLRLFLRDYEGHVEQLARAMETGRETFVTSYGEWLVPIYRHRHVPMRDVMVLLDGLRESAATVLTPAENEVAAGYFEAWAARLGRHQRLPGDHTGNKLIRFFFKGAGMGDDKWI